jgi:hypothetical protein
LLATPLASSAAVITGSVIGTGAQPVASAIVEVVGATPACRTTTAADGTFSMECGASGMHVVRASLGDLRPWQVDDIDLAPGREFHLNFMLLPASATGTDAAVAVSASAASVPASGRLPNTIVASWQDRPITLRMAAIGVAAISFVLGALTMLALGRRFGIKTRSLSPNEVGDMVLNPNMPTAGERVTPIAVAGARGAAASVSYGADEIATALADRRYGLLFVALVIAPGLFALFSLALAVAMMVGQELYLFYAMLLVPAGFVLTAIMIGAQALTRYGKNP